MTTAILLNSLPTGLRSPLVDALNEVCRNYAERRWEPSELNGGKLCEIVYTIIDGALSGNYANAPSKPRDMVAACRGLEQTASVPGRPYERSLRVLIPRMLVALYEVRNNRGVGHAGGDVDPNFMDATVVHTMCRWVVAELIRIFHQVSTSEAQTAVDTLIERKLPVIWEMGATKRVLPKLAFPRQVLLLLYSEANWVEVTDLLSWTEYTNANQFRNTVLARLHQSRQVEFARDTGRVHILPPGITTVENEILPNLGNEYY